MCCVLSPLLAGGDDLKSPTICDEKTDGLLQPPTNSREDVGFKKTWAMCFFAQTTWIRVCISHVFNKNNMVIVFFWGGRQKILLPGPPKKLFFGHLGLPNCQDSEMQFTTASVFKFSQPRRSSGNQGISRGDSGKMVQKSGDHHLGWC